MELLLAIILGSLFGFALYIVEASSPKKLLAMLRLEDLSLMKIILFGIGFSSLLLGLALKLNIFDASHIHIKAVNLGVILGGIIFGIGFGSVGTCPGTCMAATGTSGFKKAIAAVVGGLFGAFVFSITYSFWKSIGLFDTMNFGKMTLFKLTESYQSVFSVGPLGLSIGGLAFMIIAYVLPVRTSKI